MAGHEIPEPADRKQVADPVSDPQTVEETRHSCDPAFRHGVVVGFDGSTSSERPSPMPSGWPEDPAPV